VALTTYPYLAPTLLYPLGFNGLFSGELYLSDHKAICILLDCADKPPLGFSLKQKFKIISGIMTQNELTSHNQCINKVFLNNLESSVIISTGY